MSPEQIRNAYDRQAHRYDAASELIDRLATSELRQELGSRLHGRVLEVAIGTGRNLPFYSSEVTEVVGIDLSKGMLDEARQRARSLPFPVSLIQMNAEQLGFPDHAFDSVAGSEVLCTTPYPEQALAELRRVCRPGGTALFLEHVRSAHWPLRQVQNVVTPFSRRSIGCHWNRDTISAIRAAGFHIRSDRSRLLGVYHLIVAFAPAP